MVVTKTSKSRQGRPGYTRNRKTKTEVTIDELKQARYMSLTSPPASPEAKRLVDSIIDIILNTEQRKRARQPSAAVAFKSAVGLIVGDLLIGL